MENKNEEKNLEDLFREMEQIISDMEAEDVSLEDSFKLYHQGMETLKTCNTKIDTVEKKIMMLDEDGEEHEFQ